MSCMSTIRSTCLSSLCLAALLSFFAPAGHAGEVRTPDRIPANKFKLAVRTPAMMDAYDAQWKGADFAKRKSSPIVSNRVYVDGVKAALQDLRAKAFGLSSHNAKLKNSQKAITASAFQGPPTNISTKFLGLNQSTAGGYSPGYPPDTHGAASTTQLVEIVNSKYQVYKRVKTKQTGRTLQSLFNVSNPLAEEVFDPRVVFDDFKKRWVMTAAGINYNTGQGLLYIAVSKTSDASQSYYTLRFNLGTDFPDFPMLGMNQNDVFVTANLADVASRSPSDTQLFIFRKAELYTGKLNAYRFTGLPSNTAPPLVRDKSNVAYFLSSDSFTSQIEDKSLVLMRGENLDDFTAATLTNFEIDVLDYTVPPNAYQVASDELLDTSDARFVNASSQVGNSLWNAHTVSLKYYAAPKFYQIDTSTATVVQEGFFYDTETSDDFNASIVANNDNDVFVTWNSIDAFNPDPEQKHEVRTLVSGRGSSDLPGRIGPGLWVHTSPKPLTGNPSDTQGLQRWGDYSAIVIDPKASRSCPVGRSAVLFNEAVVKSTEWNSVIAYVDTCL